MAGISVQLDGQAKAIKALRFFQVDKKARVKKVVKTYTLLVGTTAKQLVAVDTGRLRSSIHEEFSNDELSGQVSTNVVYAPHQEFGTRKMKAQPFLFPAAERWRLAYLQAIAQALKPQ